MFKNRAVQIKVVKSEDATSDDILSEAMSVADTMYIINETGKGLIKGAVALTAAYISLDTARQVIVNYAPKR